MDTHFISFVQKEGVIWELDGRREGPVCWGKGSTEGKEWVNKVVEVI